MIENVCVYGATGFIGSVFTKMFPDVVVQGHDELTPQTPALLNFISTTDNYNIYTSPYLDIMTNQTFMLHILEAARLKYGNMFTFNMISSWFVYGKTTYPANEETYCNPTGFYSITKRAAEQLLISYCETYGIHWRILRLANVLGIEDKGVSAKKNALQYLIRKMVNEEPIELYNEGQFTRDYIDVRDACFAINTILTKGNINEIYNVSNGKPRIFKELIDMAGKMMDKPPQMTDVAPSEFHKVVQSENVHLDNTKLVDLGYRPRYSIKDTISRIVYQYKNDRQE